MSDDFLFGVAPYLVLVGFPAALAIRLAIDVWRGVDAREGWSRARALFRGGAAWRYGLLAVVVMHVVAWLIPGEMLLWNRAFVHLLVIEGVRLLCGVFLLVGVLHLLAAHFGRSAVRADGSPLDAALVTIVALQIVCGVAIAVFYRWASSWSAVTVTPYVISVVALQPRVELINDLPYLVRLHVFATLVGLAVLPWTTASYFIFYPLQRAALLLVSPFGRLARSAWARIEASGRPAQALAIWREEED